MRAVLGIFQFCFQFLQDKRLLLTKTLNKSFTDYASGIRLSDCSKFTVNWKYGNGVTIFWHEVIVKFFWRCFVSLVRFSYLSKFMSISSVAVGLWQFPFVRDWPEIRKSVIPRLSFCPITEDWDELGIPPVARMSLIKCFWMLQNTRFTAFTVSELLWGNKQGGEVKLLVNVCEAIYIHL